MRNLVAMLVFKYEIYCRISHSYFKSDIFVNLHTLECVCAQRSLTIGVRVYELHLVLTMVLMLM